MEPGDPFLFKSNTHAELFHSFDEWLPWISLKILQKQLIIELFIVEKSVIKKTPVACYPQLWIG